SRNDEQHQPYNRNDCTQAPAHVQPSCKGSESHQRGTQIGSLLRISSHCMTLLSLSNFLHRRSNCVFLFKTERTPEWTDYAAAAVWSNLNRLRSNFSCADTNHFFYRENEYLSVPKLPCLGRTADSRYSLLGELIGDNHFNLHFGQKVHRVLTSPI